MRSPNALRSVDIVREMYRRGRVRKRQIFKLEEELTQTEHRLDVQALDPASLPGDTPPDTELRG